MKTTYINIIGGPGTGKSTTAAYVFSEMKRMGLSVEYVSEVAKDFVWEDRESTMKIQPYISIKQYRNLVRLKGKVEYVITDSPLILGIAYGRWYDQGLPESYFQFLKDLHDTSLSPSWNFFLKRNTEYKQEGRVQSEEEAIRVSDHVHKVAKENCSYLVECYPDQVASHIISLVST